MLAFSGPGSHHGHRVVTVVTAHPGEVRIEQPPVSSVTAANTSSGGAPRATSVATRRSAACSSTS